MTKDRRWMKSILAAAKEPQVALPWARGSRRRPAAVIPTPKAPQQASAAR